MGSTLWCLWCLLMGSPYFQRGWAKRAVLTIKQCPRIRSTGKATVPWYFSADAPQDLPSPCNGTAKIRPALLLRLHPRGGQEHFWMREKCRVKCTTISHMSHNHMCKALAIFTTWRDEKEHHQLSSARWTAFTWRLRSCVLWNEAKWQPCDHRRNMRWGPPAALPAFLVSM